MQDCFCSPFAVSKAHASMHSFRTAPFHFGCCRPHQGRPDRSSVLWLTLALAVFLPLRVQAQPSDADSRPVHFWLQGGPSITTLGAGLQAGVGVAFDHHVFSLRGTSTDRAVGTETWDVAFLYGRELFVRSLHLSAGAGVAVVGGQRYRKLFGEAHGRPLDPMIGFPLEGHVSWMPTNVLAVGLHGFANVNTGQPFGGGWDERTRRKAAVTRGIARRVMDQRERTYGMPRRDTYSCHATPARRQPFQADRRAALHIPRAPAS